MKLSTEATSPPDLSDLSQALLQLDIEPAPPVTIHNRDRYYDDARLSLSRAGLALRRRLSEGSAVATLKARGTADGALHEREEIELPLEGNDWPAQVRNRVAMHTAPGLLQPHTVIDTERTRFALLQAGRTVALLSFDAVEGRSQNGTATVSFSEIEIEAVGGTDAETLRAVAAAVETLMPLVPNPVNKLDRVRQMLLLGS